MASVAVSSGVPSRDTRKRGNKTSSEPAFSTLSEKEKKILSSPAKTKEDLKGKEYDGSLIRDWRTVEAVLAPIIFTGLALFTRLYQIGKSNTVTWDEAHFGKFGSYYLKREYYFDVHPPLGKMLVGLSGYIAGYNGSFGFDSGATYPENLDYTTMRVFNAMFNVFCVPLAYYTAKQFRLSLPAVWLVTLMILFEHSYVTLGKFILLDSMLAFFTFATVLCFSRFHNLQRKAFSCEWWTWLFLTGISIGCVCSVKMVGLFATAVIGVYTVADLWIKFGNTKMPIKTYIAHWVARIVAFIVVPFCIFALCFKIHFVILNHSGPGDSNMSSLFQANLIGSDMVSGPANIAYGSKVTIKSQGLNGGLLHSHVQTYPEGSTQQQVTTYHHKDTNNNWLIDLPRPDPYYTEETDIFYIGEGDRIRLMHPSTGRNLHTHNVQAPVTKSKWEVSGYGNLTIGDEKDNWIVEIVENPGAENKTLVHPLSTSFRLKNQVLGCYLSAEGNHLPAWGFRQGEVTCDPKNHPRDKNTWFNIENHWNDRLPQGENRTLPKTHFVRDFFQLNVAMMASNNALIPDPDKKDELASKAWEWPTLHVGLRLCGWGVNNVRYFLLGHPITTWLTTAGIFVFGITTLVYLARWQRGYKDLTNSEIEKYAVAGIIPAIGWFFHYLPFIVMARVTYVHHYLPALYFAILTFGFLADLFLSRSNKFVASFVYLALYAAIIGVFYYFAPISFGMTGEPDNFKYLNWLSTWNI